LEEVAELAGALGKDEAMLGSGLAWVLVGDVEQQTLMAEVANSGLVAAGVVGSDLRPGGSLRLVEGLVVDCLVGVVEPRVCEPALALGRGVGACSGARSDGRRLSVVRDDVDPQ
jgi:hypothetical protein